ncbi:MAG: FGGY-family carbohydrate kinase [Pirellulales bacterium]
MPEKVYLAVDLGASSGRHVAGLFNGRRLELAEVHRFENGPSPAAGRLYWDLLQQWSHVRAGLTAAATKYGPRIASVGVDTWGVDFGLLGRGDELLGNPYHYRDHRTDGLLERAFQVVPREQIFAASGLQFMQFNTLYQLWAMRLAQSPLLDVAERLLMMPDLFHWLMTGEKSNEFTDASTTQMLDPRNQQWSTDLCAAFGIPRHILGDVTPPGTRLGKLRRDVAAETGLISAEVVLPGTHDTASAVMAVPAASPPAEKPNWCYISSGTWSLMGVEVLRPVISEQCRALNFTNEGGVGGTVRLLKNISGLWIVQECRKAWNRAGGHFGWEDLNLLSSAAPPLRSLINPDDPAFLSPSDMPTAIVEYCRRTGQPAPSGEGAVIRTALESLALKYRQVLGWLEGLTGGRIETIHIVGGGTQNRQLCQMAADACNRPVVAGPIEATAIGNLMMQAVSAGDVKSIAEAREVIRHSFAVEDYDPRPDAAWDEAYAKFEGLVR